MTALDWILVVLTLFTAAAGYFQGFLVGAATLAGFAGGLFAGARIGQAVFAAGSESPYAPLFGLVGALVGGMLVDLLLQRLDPGPGRRGAFLLTGGLVPLAIWAPHLAAVAIGKGIAWPVELWFGVVVMAALGGLALALLMAPPPAPADAA